VIVRIVTAKVKAERAGAFNELMRQHLPTLRQSKGLVYAKLARRMHDDAEEVVLYEEWRDTASLYEWTGPELTRPRLVPGAEELATSVTIVHYEALDKVPEVDP
jgi:heme-degrading monooxygenase HmoA